MLRASVFDANRQSAISDLVHFQLSKIPWKTFMEIIFPILSCLKNEIEREPLLLLNQLPAHEHQFVLSCFEIQTESSSVLSCPDNPPVIPLDAVCNLYLFHWFCVFRVTVCEISACFYSAARSARSANSPHTREGSSLYFAAEHYWPTQTWLNRTRYEPAINAPVPMR